jgi:hypothetical protein
VKVLTLALVNLILATNLFVVSKTFASEKSNPTKLLNGIYEGISEGLTYTYNMFIFGKSGEHALWEVSIRSGLREFKIYKFSNKDIHCGYSKCDAKAFSDENQIEITLYFSKYKEGFSVLQGDVAEGEQVLNRKLYDVKPQKAIPTAKNIVETYREQLKYDRKNSSDGMFGFWVGVANDYGSNHLAILKVSEKEKSEFVIFQNGNSISKKATFSYGDLVLDDEQFYKVTAEYGSAELSLILHVGMSGKQINGSHSRYDNGTLFQHGNFEFYKVR